jgi:hypothetical protein
MTSAGFHTPRYCSSNMYPIPRTVRIGSLTSFLPKQRARRNIAIWASTFLSGISDPPDQTSSINTPRAKTRLGPRLLISPHTVFSHPRSANRCLRGCGRGCLRRIAEKGDFLREIEDPVADCFRQIIYIFPMIVRDHDDMARIRSPPFAGNKSRDGIVSEYHAFFLIASVRHFASRDPA